MVHGWTPLLLAARHGHSKVAKAGRLPMGPMGFLMGFGVGRGGETSILMTRF